MAATCSGKEIYIGSEEEEEDDENNNYNDYDNTKIGKSCMTEFFCGELIARIKCLGTCIA